MVQPLVRPEHTISHVDGLRAEAEVSALIARQMRRGLERRVRRVIASAHGPVPNLEVNGGSRIIAVGRCWAFSQLRHIREW